MYIILIISLNLLDVVLQVDVDILIIDDDTTICKSQEKALISLPTFVFINQ